MNNKLFLLLTVLMAIFVVAGIAFIVRVRVIFDPDLPLWMKLLLLK